MVFAAAKGATLFISADSSGGATGPDSSGVMPLFIGPQNSDNNSAPLQIAGPEDGSMPLTITYPDPDPASGDFDLYIKGVQGGTSFASTPPDPTLYIDGPPSVSGSGLTPLVIADPDTPRTNQDMTLILGSGEGGALDNQFAPLSIRTAENFFEAGGGGTIQTCASPTEALLFLAPSFIQRSAGSFVDDGFENGMTITVTGTSSNDGTYTINTVAATQITTNELTISNEGPLTSSACISASANPVFPLYIKTDFNSGNTAPLYIKQVDASGIAPLYMIGVGVQTSNINLYIEAPYVDQTTLYTLGYSE